MTFFIGLDISTTSAKAIIIDSSGKVMASHSVSQPISQPKPLWSEQNPADWWDGMVVAIRGALAEADLTGDAIDAIGLTGQMHGLVMLSDEGQVLRPAILWNDQRTQAQCDEMTTRIGFERLIELTGNRALTGFTAPKILWVRDHEPDIYGKCAHVLLPKDYIRFQLTGEYAMDASDASGTGLLNVASRTWSQEVVETLGIPLSWLPPVVEGTAIAGTITAEVASLTGLKAGTPVVAGGGDQATGAVGMGAVEPHIIGLTLGTSGVVFAPLSHYSYEPQGRLHAFCHAVPNLWHFMGVMLSAAGSLQWYKDTLGDHLSYDALLGEASQVPAGSDGLYFLPYLTGERTPHPDPHARGAFIGLTSRHTRAHMTRAVLEGVAFGLKDSFTLIEQAGIPQQLEVRVSGGGTKSQLWQQIIADVIGQPLVNVNTVEGGAFGAGILASVGGGAFPDVPTACQALVMTSQSVSSGANTAQYQEHYAIYRELYPALQAIYSQIQ
jgi:xylulokinase